MKIKAPFAILRVRKWNLYIFLLVPFVGKGYDYKDGPGMKRPTGRFGRTAWLMDYLFVKPVSSESKVIPFHHKFAVH